MNRLFFVLLALTFRACQPNSRSAGKTDIGQLTDSLTLKLEAIHAKGFINGFGVVIVNEEGTLYAKGLGYANAQTKARYTQQTIQNIGSVSKTFIGLALLKAQDLKLLHLDDPVSKYLPFEVKNPHFPEDPITIRQLATHTSSLLDTDAFDEHCYILKEDVMVADSLKAMTEEFKSPGSMMPMVDFMEKLLSQDGEWYNESGFLDHKPGAVFEYSNVGASLAATVLEIATGQSFNAFTTKHILKPLNMTSSGWSFADIDLNQHSTLYAKTNLEIPYYSLVTYPDGGLITSVADMGKYLTELIKGFAGEGTLLSNEAYEELFREQLQASHFPEERGTDDAYDDEYNSGIFMGFSPKGYVGHTGGDPGIATYMFFNAEAKTGKLLMINTSVRGSEGGVAEFYDVWYTLEKYERRLSQAVSN